MPQNEPAQDAGALIESVITKGDLSRLTPQERTRYYTEVCRSIGLNPFTKPLEYLTLNGKMVLYARRDAADQLRKINGISIEVVSRKVEEGLCVVHVRAHDKNGRTDEDFGAVSIAGLKGEALANAQLKSITKAKRRVTLSISGLGFLDETEVDDDTPRWPAVVPYNTTSELDQFAAETGDTDGDMLPPPERNIIAEAREQAERGTLAFRDFWRVLSPSERDSIRDHLAALQRTAATADDPFGLPPAAVTDTVTEPPAGSYPRSSLWTGDSYRIEPDKLLDGTANWQKWRDDMQFLIGEASADEIDKWKSDNRDYTNLLRKSQSAEYNAVYRDVMDAITVRLKELALDAGADA